MLVAGLFRLASLPESCLLERYAQAQFDLAVGKGQVLVVIWPKLPLEKIAIGLAEMRRVGGVIGL